MIAAGGTAWAAALVKAEGGAFGPQYPPPSREAQSLADPSPPAAPSLFQVQNTLTITDWRGKREEGEKGAASFDLRELSGFEKINFFPRRNLQTLSL